jgi:hypothetical protein
MLFYKKLFKNKISIAGAGGGGGSPEPSFLMPPDGAFTKVGFQLYEALDLICEGPILGLSDQKGKVLIGSLRAKKEFNSSSNEIGSSTEGIDKAVYFDDIPLRDERDSPNLGKYDVSLQLGKQFQEAPVIGAFPERIQNVSTPVKGPYDMTDNREVIWTAEPRYRTSINQNAKTVSYFYSTSQVTIEKRIIGGVHYGWRFRYKNVTQWLYNEKWRRVIVNGAWKTVYTRDTNATSWASYSGNAVELRVFPSWKGISSTNFGETYFGGPWLNGVQSYNVVEQKKTGPYEDRFRIIGTVSVNKGVLKTTGGEAIR